MAPSPCIFMTMAEATATVCVTMAPLFFICPFFNEPADTDLMKTQWAVRHSSSYFSHSLSLSLSFARSPRSPSFMENRDTRLRAH